MTVALKIITKDYKVPNSVGLGFFRDFFKELVTYFPSDEKIGELESYQKEELLNL